MEEFILNSKTEESLDGFNNDAHRKVFEYDFFTIFLNTRSSED